jgi:hypothetical protein
LLIYRNKKIRRRANHALDPDPEKDPEIKAKINKKSTPRI